MLGMGHGMFPLPAQRVQTACGQITAKRVRSQLNHDKTPGLRGVPILFANVVYLLSLWGGGCYSTYVFVVLFILNCVIDCPKT